MVRVLKGLVALGVAVVLLVVVNEYAGFVPLGAASSPCSTKHVDFDLGRLASSDQLSSDQRAVLGVDGPPQAFTWYLDAESGSIVEEWDYFTTGRELIFVDGAYSGGVQVPPPQVVAGAQLPELPAFPWEISSQPTSDCVVKLAGPALFLTSVLVLPGWNDEQQVARLWTLAGGGTMITVDGKLVLASLDPGQAVDLGPLEDRGPLVGTLEGAVEGVDRARAPEFRTTRVGAILSGRPEQRRYHLSISPRGQGTTEDGAELMFVLQGESLDGTFVLGQDASARTVAIDGSERPVESSGSVTVRRAGSEVRVEVEGTVDGKVVRLQGPLQNGLWRGGGLPFAPVIGMVQAAVQSLVESSGPVVDEAYRAVEPLFERLKLGEDKPRSSLTSTPVSGRAPGGATPTASKPPTSRQAVPEAPSGWQVAFQDTFDRDTGEWRTGDYTGSSSRSTRTVERGVYRVETERLEGKPWSLFFTWKRVDAGSDFFLTFDVEQEDGGGNACGLTFGVIDGGPVVRFLASSAEGKYSVYRVTEAENPARASWRSSPAIVAGGVNRLSVLVRNGRSTFFVNGKPIQEENGQPDAQHVGVLSYVSTDRTVVCSFDNFELRVP